MIQESLSRPSMQPGVPETPRGGYEVRPYKPEDAPRIYQELEVPNWAPWLRASPETLAKRAEVFPEGQLAVWTPEGRPIASLSLSRFNYNDPQALPTWDEIMGDPPTGEHTFVPDGNAVGMMSINVHPEFQGARLTRVIIEDVKKRAKELGVKHIMGSFRPSQFGEYTYENPREGFVTYALKERPDNLPLDAWLRALARNGMRMLRVDDAAMVVPEVPMGEFNKYRETYNPEKWKQIAPHVWRCGETGVWITGEKFATYVESNIWGILEENGNGNSNQEVANISSA